MLCSNVQSERQYYFKLVDLGKIGHDKYICIQNYLAAGYEDSGYDNRKIVIFSQILLDFRG